MGARKRKQLERAREARAERIMALARSGSPRLPPFELVVLGRSRSGEDRAFAFIQMTDSIGLKEGPELHELQEFLAVAGPRLSDPDPVARDFAMYVVSWFSRDYPAEVWEYVCTHVTRIGRPSREYLGVTVLEELLEYHFEMVFAALQQEVQDGNQGFLDPLAFSYFDGLRGANYKKARAYLEAQHFFG